jgi:catechol 2,3-dioxygenase-like lactoylglutathione lyase family enzyme
MSARLDMIGLVVEDMARSLAFYRELGFEFAADAEGKPHVEATCPAGCGSPGTRSTRSSHLTRIGRSRAVTAGSGLRFWSTTQAR